MINRAHPLPLSPYRGIWGSGGTRVGGGACGPPHALCAACGLAGLLVFFYLRPAQELAAQRDCVGCLRSCELAAFADYKAGLAARLLAACLDYMTTHFGARKKRGLAPSLLCHLPSWYCVGVNYKAGFVFLRFALSLQSDNFFLSLV